MSCGPSIAARVGVWLIVASCARAVAAADAVVVVGIQGDPGHFNPAITTGGGVHAVADSLFNGLVGLDQNQQPVPDLATSWQVSSDGLTYTFTLADARWHDGEPFTSADVKFTFENMLLKYHARTRAGLGALIAGIDAPAPGTVVFRLKSPHPALLRRLDVTEAPILPKHIYHAVADPTSADANGKPIGTGPFRLARYDRDATIVLERNKNYFKPGLPKLDRLVFRIIKDPGTRVLAYERGEIDYLPGVEKKDVALVMAKGGTTVLQHSSGSGGGNCINTLSFNLERERLRDPGVRKAIALSINRNRIVEQVLFGQGRVAQAPISSAVSWAHAGDSLAGYPFDPERANALLDGAQFPRGAGGTRFKLDIVFTPAFNKYAELMKQDLAAVGIDLVFRPLDFEAFVETIFKKRDFETNLISYCNGVDPDIGVRRMYVSDNIGPIPFSNAAAYRNKRIDTLFERAGMAGTEAERGAFYKEIQTILAADLPYWWLVETTNTTLHKDTLTGFKPWTGQFAEEARLK